MYAVVNPNTNKVIFTGRDFKELENRAKRMNIPFLIVDETQFRNYEMFQTASTESRVIRARI